MKFIYTIFFILLTPFILLRLYWKGIKAPAYRLRWRERFGLYAKNCPQNCIWIHAVSVGEAEAVFPLIKQIQASFPLLPILVTTTTITGSMRVQSVLGDSISHVYLPYDIPYVIHNFFQHFKPKMAVIMEKEIWPNLFSECGNKKIPLFIINARLSKNSAKNYKKIPNLVIPTLQNVTCILTQTEEDRQHFISIGASATKVKVTGNLKFDINLPKELIDQGLSLKKTSLKDRFVWIAASTHKGEEAILLRCYQQLKKEIPELLLMIAPRHPERFSEVKTLVESERLNLIMRSSHTHCTEKTDVYIADTMGELKMLYVAADISFIGGSLTPVGGHNILEALSVGTPVLFGSYMHNFKEIAQNVLAEKASIQCISENNIVTTIQFLYQSPSKRKQLVQNGQRFLNNNLGATQKTIKTLIPHL